MVKTPVLFALLISMLLFTPSGWAQGDADGYVETGLETAQNQFDYYIKYSAMTQIKPNGGTPGGPGGHAFIFIKGLCKDYSKPYNAVIPCDEATFPPGLEHDSVGISIDNDLLTTAFLVFPLQSGSKVDLFFRGVKVWGLLDESERQAMIDEVIRLRVFEGVKVKPALVGPTHPLEKQLEPGQPIPPDFELRKMIYNAIGTDFAIQFGRNQKIVGFRTGKWAMKPMADFANQFNEPFVTLKKTYQWSGFKANCAHLSAALLAQACVRNSIGQWLPWYKQIFNIALPANGLSTLQTLVHHGGRNLIQQTIAPGRSGIEFETIRKNQLWWGLLTQGRPLPVGLGAFSERIKSHQGDDLYLDNIFRARIPHQIPGANIIGDRVFERAEFLDWAPHLEYWGDAYEKAYLESLARKQTPDRVLYQNWLQREIAEHNRVREAVGIRSCREIILDQRQLASGPTP